MKFQKIIYLWTSLSKQSLINLMCRNYSSMILLFDTFWDISIFLLLKCFLKLKIILYWVKNEYNNYNKKLSDLKFFKDTRKEKATSNKTLAHTKSMDTEI